MECVPEKKKRGRKAKAVVIKNTETDIPVKFPKKRGRKPKGGKIIIQSPNLEKEANTKMNIILHLKCSLKDIEDNADKDNDNKKSNIDTFKFADGKLNDLNYMIYNPTKNNTSDEKKNQDISSDNMKQIWQKLEKLSSNLHLNNICNKKSACFFCTCDFDNTPIYIPKHELNNTYHVYGCFCSPECACAFLMEEKILDTATRFERYYLLNYLYCKIYNYTKNIKPAPSPYYTLDKYYGNLSIQEYRQLLKNERLLLVVDKPLSRLLPELHDDCDDYLLNYQNISSGSKYNLQNQDILKSKNDIVNKQFNIKN